jgi:hypothetical protein
LCRHGRHLSLVCAPDRKPLLPLDGVVMAALLLLGHHSCMQSVKLSIIQVTERARQILR